MKHKNTILIAVVLFNFFFSNSIAQKKITLSHRSEKDSIILSEVGFNKKHSTKKSIDSEINNISKRINHLGYFTHSIENIKKNDSLYHLKINLGEKVESITICYSSQKKEKIKITELKNYIENISKKLNLKGKGFSKVSLKNIRLKEATLYADLKIIESKTRKIDYIILKGYDQFPKSFIKHQLDIKKNEVFTKEKLISISKNTKYIDFCKEIKKPEVLFSKDSTIIYLYIKKKNANQFDGLLSFSTNKQNKLIFNGNLNLKLKNALNFGESIYINWTANENKQQDFTIYSKTPFLFNSPISQEIKFNLYKQDSSFLNTSLDLKTSYNISKNKSISIDYNSKVSNQITDTTISEYKSKFYGLSFKYKSKLISFFNKPKLLFRISPFLGHRESNKKRTPQKRIHIEAHYTQRISKKGYLFIKNKTKHLFSEDLLKNELYRIGGANSIRGFNEKSIFTSNFSIVNLEYRYLTSNTSFLYTISDFAKTKENKLLGIGIGYLFRVKDSKININYTLGKTNNTKIDFNQSKISIQLINTF